MNFWIEENIYKFDPDEKGRVFSIDTPPPYANGPLHFGHRMSYSHIDFISRFKRMSGETVFFPLGFDDNGHPTERFVEQKYGVKAHQLPRHEFIELCEREVEQIEQIQLEQLKRLGLGTSFSNCYRTIGENAQRVAQLSFIELCEKGVAYRARSPTVWCPSCGTVLAQADLQDVPANGTLNDIKFTASDGDIEFIVATTRPELLPSCVAVLYNEADDRYKHLKGLTASTPLFHDRVPILGDRDVDPKFGTGLVMVCTFGDKTDVNWWRRYKLPLRETIGKNGRLLEEAGEYAGLTVKEARKRIIEDLSQNGSLTGQETISSDVSVCERCKTPVEYMVTQQWFLRTMDFKDDLLNLGRQLDWRPPYMERRFEDWVNGLEWDWPISRQRHYGVPFPVTYCMNCGNVVLPNGDALPVDPSKSEWHRPCPKCGCRELEPERDVMDTWMTSSMTPFIITHWREDEKRFSEMFPLSMRAQAHEIIRTWAFYTILKSYLHAGSIPWKTIAISGWGLTSKGGKASKSKGGAADFIGLGGASSMDAFRYWAATPKLGQDCMLNMNVIGRGFNICNKLWNAARLASMHLKRIRDVSINDVKLDVSDHWILGKLSKVISTANDAWNRLDFSTALKSTGIFFKLDFCDYYLEMIKHRLYDATKSDAGDGEAARLTFGVCLREICKLFAPIMPFITEAIWQELFREPEGDKSIHLSPFPKPIIARDEESVRLGELAKRAISEIRKWKTRRGESIGKAIDKLAVRTNYPSDLAKVSHLIKGTMRIIELGVEEGNTRSDEIEILDATS